MRIISPSPHYLTLHSIVLMKYLFVILSFFYFGQVHAQYDPSKVDKKALKCYLKSQDQARDDHLQEGLESLKEAVTIDNRYEDAYLSMAGMYSELKNYQAAVDNYKIARSIDSIYFIDYSLSYSINLAGLGNFGEALAAVNDFKSIPNLNESSLRAAAYRTGHYQFAIDYAAKKNNAIINSNRIIWATVLTRRFGIFSHHQPGWKTFWFIHAGWMDINEDFYESDRTENGWTKARALAGNINSNNNEGALNISQDGQWLIFTGCNFPNGFGSCDLFISYLTPEGWSTPENLGPNFNTEFWESGSFPFSG